MVFSFFRVPKCGCADSAPLCRNLSLTSHPVTFPTPVRTGFHAAGIGPIPRGTSSKINLQILSANSILCVYRETETSINQSINAPIYLNQHPPSFTSCSNDQIFTCRQVIKGQSLLQAYMRLTPLDLAPLLCFYHIWSSVTLSHAFCQKG